MGRRDEVIPADFLEHLRHRLRHFDAEPMPVQMSVGRMLWHGTYRSREHAHYAGCLTFTHQELDEWFGRRKFSAINDRLSLFEVTHWSVEENFTKGYRMKPQTALVLERYFVQRRVQVTDLLFGDGDKLKTIPHAIASKDFKGRTTSWPEAVGLRLVPVNIEKMKVLRSYLAKELKQGELQAGLFTGALNRPRLERLLDETNHMIRLAQAKPSGRGYIAHRYQQSKSGRLYGKGWSLQNVGVIVKQAALYGMWEYDFANCHYSIMAQMASRFDCRCDAIEHYLSNKTSVRKAIADQAGIPIDQAKVCLLAAMYGARQSLWPATAIPKEIGTEAAERLYGVDLFAAIHADIRRARQAILNGWDRDRQGRLANIFGRTIGGKETAEQILAHLIQGVEAAALRAILVRYPCEIVLVQHDGFAAGQRLCCRTIEETAKEATGYTFKVEEECIHLAVDVYFQARRIQNDCGLKPKQAKASRPSLAR
jgi:hypothetical protein